MRKIISMLGFSAVAMMLVSCGGDQVEKGNGKLVDSFRQVPAFEDLQVKGNFQVLIDYNAPQAITVNTDSNLQPYVQTLLKGNVLTVGVKKGFNVKPSQPIKVTINTKKLESVRLVGAVYFRVNKLKSRDFRINVNGTSNVILAGKVDNVDYILQGLSTVDAKLLKAQKVLVKIQGSGKINVSAAKKLTVKINGLGKVTYFGSPPEVEQVVYGGGEVIPGSK